MSVDQNTRQPQGPRYAQANRIFVAILAGLIAGIAVSSVATADAASVAVQIERAPILA